MEFQLSDAVLQSIFEPVIVTDGKGHVLKREPGRGRIARRSRRRPHGAGQHPRRRPRSSTPFATPSPCRRPLPPKTKPHCCPCASATASAATGSHHAMRDSEGRLLGAVTTLEDVTSLQDTDRFKTQFITVASRKLHDPLLQPPPQPLCVDAGLRRQTQFPLQARSGRHGRNEAENLDDLMSDLIEVAELDTGKRELQLERLRPSQALSEAATASREARPKAHPHQRQCVCRSARRHAPIAAPCAPFSTTCSRTPSATRRHDGEILLAAEEVKDFVQFTCATLAAASRPNGSAPSGTGSAPPERGTGMGLALVRRLVESLGGQIAVESRLDHGTTFRFTLPIAVRPLSIIRSRWAERYGRNPAGRTTVKNRPSCASIIGAAPGVGKTYQHAERCHLMKHQQRRRRRHRPR